MSPDAWTLLWVVLMVLGGVGLWMLRRRLFAMLDQVERDEDERVRLKRAALAEE